MGRRKHLLNPPPEAEEAEWPFKTNINIPVKRIKPKIAFLSGLERAYYPEEPGTSKFGLMFAPPYVEDIPSSIYYPSTETLQKPISTIGYGIGGLSTPRFPVLNTETYPGPGHYNPNLRQSLLLEEHDYQESHGHHESDRHYSSLFGPHEHFQLDKNSPYLKKLRRAKLRMSELQCTLGFGTMKSIPRFGHWLKSDAMGPALYISKKEKSSYRNMTSSFGRSPVTRQMSTKIRCIIDHDSEKCIECGKSLAICDYYRTRFAVPVPLPEFTRITDLGKNFPIGLTTHVNLCNMCYYRAAQGYSKNWPKKKLRWLFQKTRTCATIHEHHLLPQTIHKTQCKMTKKLLMKENILSKYYEDRVEESISLKDFERAIHLKHQS